MRLKLDSHNVAEAEAILAEMLVAALGSVDKAAEKLGVEIADIEALLKTRSSTAIEAIPDTR